MTEAQQAELRQDVRLKYGTLITDEGTWELMEFAYMSGMTRAARCNDTAPVAPIGDAEFEWPRLPALTGAMRKIYSVSLFTEHQMQGYANAYGEAVRVAVLAAVSAQGKP